MREIKFRVWDGIEMSFFLLDNEFDCHSGWLENSILMQFTGLQDKNGVDIYEGDKLVDDKNREYEVVYESYFFGIKHSFYGTTGIRYNTHLRFEVIGNIHE